MKTVTIVKTLSILSIALLLGAGCGGATEETTKQETQSATTIGTFAFTVKDPEKGIIKGTYTLEGHTIIFEVMRGEKNPLLSKFIDPGAPDYAIDAQFCDKQNYCFVQQAGGHSLADPNWTQPSDKAPTLESITASNKALRSFNSDIKTIEKQDIHFFDGLTEEAKTLERLSGHIDPYITPEQSNAERTLQKSVLSLAATASNTYTHIFEIWWKPAVGIAEHSGTRTTSTYLGQTWSQLATCNHGACAANTSQGMALSCSRAIFNRPLAIAVKNKCDQPIAPASASMHSSLLGCCSTAYGLTGGYHVCNDDSRIQRDIFVANGPVSASFCADWIPQGWAPGCS